MAWKAANLVMEMDRSPAHKCAWEEDGKRRICLEWPYYTELHHFMYWIFYNIHHTYMFGFVEVDLTQFC